MKGLIVVHQGLANRHIPGSVITIEGLFADEETNWDYLMETTYKLLRNAAKGKCRVWWETRKSTYRVHF